MNSTAVQGALAFVIVASFLVIVAESQVSEKERVSVLRRLEVVVPHVVPQALYRMLYRRR